MPRYIDADKLREVMERYDDYAVDIVDDAPTVDAVEIVRCKYCKHYDFSEVNITPYSEWYKCKVTGMYTPQTHYCGFGERRGNV